MPIERGGGGGDLDDDEKRLWGTNGDWSIYYDSTAGRLVVRDETTGEDRAYLNDNGTWQFVSQAVDVNGQDLQDGATTIWDQAAGELIANLNAAQVIADQATINEQVATAGLTSDQTISTGSVTTVNLDTANIEDDNVLDVQTSNNRIQSQVDGRYFISGTWRIAGSANWSSGDVVVIQLDIGGSQVATKTQIHVGANANQSMTISAVRDLTGTNNITLEAFHDSGSDETLQSNANGTLTKLEVVKVG